MLFSSPAQETPSLSLIYTVLSPNTMHGQQNALQQRQHPPTSPDGVFNELQQSQMPELHSCSGSSSVGHVRQGAANCWLQRRTLGVYRHLWILGGRLVGDSDLRPYGKMSDSFHLDAEEEIHTRSKKSVVGRFLLCFVMIPPPRPSIRFNRSHELHTV